LSATKIPRQHHTCFLPRWFFSPPDLLPSLLTPRPTQYRKGFAAASPRRAWLPSPRWPRQPGDSPPHADRGSPTAPLAVPPPAAFGPRPLPLHAGCGSPPHADRGSPVAPLAAPPPVASKPRTPLHAGRGSPPHADHGSPVARLPMPAKAAWWLPSPRLHRPHLGLGHLPTPALGHCSRHAFTRMPTSPCLQQDQCRPHLQQLLQVCVTPIGYEKSPLLCLYATRLVCVYYMIVVCLLVWVKRPCGTMQI
jgi:hypothetical protein